MKKIIAWFLLFMLLLVPLAVQCEEKTQKVFDGAGAFSQQEIAALENQIAEFEKKYGLEFSIVTNKKAHSNSAMEFADDLYDSGKYGVNPYQSGFLFLLDLSDSAYALSTCGKAVDYYTYEKAYDFENQIVTALRNAKYGYTRFATACGTSVSLISELMNSYYRYDVFSGQMKMAGERAITRTEIFIVVIIAIAVGLILSFSTLSSYHLKGETYHYELEKNSSVTLTKKEDAYLRTKHTRTRIPTNTGSGGGGFSGGGGGANVHRSSGGFTHGGSSGHF